MKCLNYYFLERIFMPFIFFSGGGERGEEQRETEIGHQKAKIASNKNYVFEIIKKGFAINKPLKSCFA